MVWHKTQAFTLVELIVVITILAILWTIVFISLQGYSTSARDSTRVSDFSSMKTALELYQLDAGKYPQATDWVNITYSWATVWNQGTFGETVFSNVDRLDKIPTDPLTDKEYTYSVTSIKNQYQLGWLVEGDEMATSHLITGANAWTTEAQAYITWNYNWQMTKSLSWTLCNILALPSIITNDTSITDLQQIVASESLVYRGYKNLPSSFKDSKFKADGWFVFQPNTLVAYTDTSSCEPLTDKTSYTARVELLKGLQDAYSGTLLKDEWELKNILALEINTTTPSNEVINYAGNYVNNVLGGKIEWATPTLANCSSWSLDWYNYGALTHNQTENVTKSWNLANGVQDFGAQANCNNGIVTLTDEINNIVCNSGYVEQAWACVQDVCGSTVPANAHSNATSQTVSQTWTQNTTPGVCTFVCDTNYTWNGSTCVANTQSVTCWWSVPSNATTTTGTNYTQTWNGSAWSPITIWGENQATCDFNCNSGYAWDWSSCAEAYPWCDYPNITVWSYTISACNVWTNIAWTTSASYWYYFQWWNNGWTPSGTITPSTTLVDASSYGPGNYYNSTTFIGWAGFASPYDWASSQNNNLWWNTTNTTIARQGPCASGYHVPSQSEWSWLVTAWGWWTNGTNMMNALKLPIAGFRFWDGVMNSAGGRYWSSSTSGTNAYFLHFFSSNIGPSQTIYRSHGLTVRCFKN